jgi:glycosyltransferase involved in cell wall biosynthesis
MTRPLRVLAQPGFTRREMNPYNWQLSTSLQAAGVEVHEFSKAEVLRGGYDLWHMHWPEGHLNHGMTLACRRSVGLPTLMWRARARGVRTVWTVHNLHAHERLYPRLEAGFRRAFLSQLDGVISLSERADAAAVARFPQLTRIPRFVVPHGHYRRLYPNEVSPAEARARLGVAPGAPSIGFFGLIRDYKNVPELIAAARQLPDPDLAVVVAGRPASDELAGQIRTAAAADPRVRLRLELIPENDVQVVFNAVDLVVLPYREILNSGAALLALSFNRPVLIPDAGTMPELQERVGPEWVRLYRGRLTPDALADALRWCRRVPRVAVAPLGDFDWDAIARSTLGAYRQIMAARQPHARLAGPFGGWLRTRLAAPGVEASRE